MPGPIPDAAPLLEVQGLARRYRDEGGNDTAVFENVDCRVAGGEFVAIVGDSGVGKSTLLNCLAGLDEWQQGRVLHQGLDLSGLDEAGRALWRRSHVGFVFQAFHVLPHLDVWHNVCLPLMLLQRLDAQGRQRVERLLQAVGLQGLQTRLPWQLSGGQLQRVAIARALVHAPALLLADEPTGNLDPGTAAQIMDLLLHQTREHGAALVLVTHSMEAARRADRVLRLTAQGMRPA
ncbi:Lipoprotein-releasing system ATP-binding protein LolD [Delftia tsuruhatensis]|uniref:ABC transporter ATP-binding protein n=1 Tax=Delftia tsuruhatensis TaxID=180282 RepID=UPI001E6D6181|nr:ABC transporter ATP-binding protein [Delftia tsuruhatensis]CAB5657252.1 Lipoprotein-releasing system ATP-binding protein LolD [Delftia tsuruhatensis]CAC9679154.1 Lipoprotein-releasing system ATP-binding protein LolD [Delftia tsuruhatensis]